ncbi:MAG: 2-oxoacid:acceptor oxidoreductase family protein [Oscillospiraceae bacterium]|jgi:2-oxoglutarate ferredoxin oxidoreductase subunit gamma|nr:2-oxoacid:acceptor oxidoreductase family protein [Oscillospiraceae bacterium]
MKKDLNLLLAGFGGQGLLFAGKVIAYCGLIEERQLSWLPSYGPEMRGGTANCGVSISDEPIGSPLVVAPNQLIVMNQPSLEKFIDAVPAGGLVLVDSTMISARVTRSDVTVHYVPATAIAEDEGLKGLANIILVGKLFAEYPFCEADTLTEAIRKSVPASKKEMFDFNVRAAKLGMDYGS